MARNDGVDRTIVRNHDLKAPGDVAKIQEHNEREKTHYSNQDIVSERTADERTLQGSDRELCGDVRAA